MEVTPEEWRERQRPIGNTEHRQVLLSAGMGRVYSLARLHKAICYTYYDEFHSWGEVAQVLGVDVATIYRWRERWKEQDEENKG